VLLKQAQPERLKPIEFWPNGTTEVVPFPNIGSLFKTHADINNVAIVSPDKFGLC